MKSAIPFETYSKPFDCSVIIPVHNRKTTVLRAIESVTHQTAPLREIIVIDDGSTDGVGDLLRSEYPKIKLLTQPNLGVSAARNRGIAESRGEWLAFLDSDDEWLPAKLEVQWNWLNAQPHIKVCHCDEFWIRNDVRVNPKQKHRKSGGWIYTHCLPLCVISPSAVLIHRSVFEVVGRFDESLPVCEDYDLWLRITSKYEIGYVDQPLLIKYGGHNDQLSKAYPAMDRFRIQALIKSLEQNTLSFEQRLKTLNMIVQKIEIYLIGAKKRNKTSQIQGYQAMLEAYQAELNRIET